MPKKIFICFFIFINSVYSQPSNNTPCNAFSLSNANCLDGSTIPSTDYTTVGASALDAPVIPPACWTSGFSNTVWFSFIATAVSQKISTNVQLLETGFNNDNQIAVYSSSDNTCAGTFTLIGCQDDICDCTGSANNQNAEVTVSGLTIGSTYWIAVDGDENNTGKFRIGTQPAPANDGCSNPLAMALGVTYNTSNIGASPYTDLGIGDVRFSCGSNENMVFYSFTPVSTGIYYLNQWNQFCSNSSGTQTIIFDPAYNCNTLPLYPHKSAQSLFELLCSGSTLNARYYTLNLIGGVTYMIGIDGFAGTECSYNLNIDQAIVLPVDLLTINAYVQKDKAFINWSTSSENNCDFFSIERSLDAIEFEEIGKLNGAGNSTIIKNYNYQDLDFVSGKTYYYRIKQVDFDGRFTFSKIVSLEKIGEATDLNVLNNPVSDYLSISFNSERRETRVLNIYSTLGNLIVSEELTVNEGPNNFSTDVIFLPKGMYLITLTGKAGIEFTKVIKE